MTFNQNTMSIQARLLISLDRRTILVKKSDRIEDLLFN